MPYIGQRPATGEANSFKILDDISNYTLTFGSSDVNVSADTITAREHRFVTGQRVTYGNGGGTDPTGLSDGTVYYIIVEDRHTFKLATNASNAVAGTAINITAAGAGAAHTINVKFDGVNTKFKATHSNGTKADISQSGQLMVSVNGVLQQPHDNTTTPSTGYATDHTSTIIFSAAPAANDQFFGRLIASNFATFDISDNTVDNFTGNGNDTTFTLSKAPPNNESILVTIDGVVQYPDDNAAVRAYTVSENILDFASAPGNGVEIQVRHIGFAGASTAAVSGFYGRTGNASLKNTDDIVFRNANVGVVTATDIRITGNLTVDGTTTTLDTELVGVDKLEVAANNTTVAAAITQTGSGDILNLYDGASEVFSVADGGAITINSVPGTNNNANQSVLFQTAAGVIDGGSGLLYNPAEDALKVNGNVITSTGVNASGAGPLKLSAANYSSTQYIKVSNKIEMQGSVGIGTDNPADKLSIYAPPNSLVFGAKDTTRGNHIFQLLADDSAGNGELRLYQNSASGTHTKTVEIASSGNSYLVGGNFGLGTNNPAAPLHVFSTAYPTATIQRNHAVNYPRFRLINTANDGADLDGIGDGTGGFRISTVTGGTSTERFRITSSGTLTVTPANTTSSYATTDGGIDIAQTISSTGTSSSQSIGIAFSLNKSGQTGAIAEIGAIREGSGLSGLVFRTRDNSTGRNERLRITSAGKVLVSGQASLTSTSLPHPVQIAADSDAQNIACFGRASDDISAIDFYEADKSTLLGELQYRRDHLNLRHRVGYISFATGGTTERLRITSAGDVCIGGHSTNYADSPLEVRSTNNGGDVAIRVTNNTTTTGSKAGIIFTNSTGDFTSAGIAHLRNDNALIFYNGQSAGAGGFDNATERLRITSGGQVNIGGSYTQTTWLTHIEGAYNKAGLRVVSGAPGYSDPFVVATSTGGERFRITGDGNIGISETDPYYKLHMVFSNAATSLSGGGEGNWGSDGIRIENTNTTVGSMSLAHFRNYDADWHIGSKYVASNNSNLVFLAEGSEKLRIDVNGNVKFGTIADTTAAVTNTPVYIAMQSDLSTFEAGEGAATTGLLRLEETGSNNNRYHGIEIRNKNFGDIRILNQDVTTSDRGNLVIAMPDADASDGVHRKLVFNSLASAIQISGKGGAVAGNGSETHTDIYLATKTGVTAIDTGAGSAVAGLIRFEDIGSNSNRYHGIEIRNRNSGDARILNLDEGTTNKANLVFGVDNGSTVTEAMRIASSTDIGINTPSPLAKLHVNLTKSSGSSTADRTKQHAAMRLSLDRTSGSMPYLGWGPALDFYSDNYDSGTQRPNARIAGTISNYSAGDEGGQLRFYTTPTDTATGESDFVERYRIESTGMIRHSGGHGNNSGNLAAGAYYRIVASQTVPASSSVTFVISGLASGWMTIRGGGYSNAGQSQYSLMYQLGGYMTATNTYDAYEVRIWANGAGISTQKNAGDFRITISNNSGSYGLNTNWIIEGSNNNIKIRT